MMEIDHVCEFQRDVPVCFVACSFIRSCVPLTTGLRRRCIYIYCLFSLSLRIYTPILESSFRCSLLSVPPPYESKRRLCICNLFDRVDNQNFAALNGRDLRVTIAWCHRDSEKRQRKVGDFLHFFFAQKQFQNCMRPHRNNGSMPSMITVGRIHL